MPSCSNHQPFAATPPHLDEQAGHAQHGLQAGLRLLRRLQRQQRHGVTAAAAGAEGAPQPAQRVSLQVREEWEQREQSWTSVTGGPTKERCGGAACGTQAHAPAAGCSATHTRLPTPRVRGASPMPQLPQLQPRPSSPSSTHQGIHIHTLQLPQPLQQSRQLRRRRLRLQALVIHVACGAGGRGQ